MFDHFLAFGALGRSNFCHALPFAVFLDGLVGRGIIPQWVLRWSSGIRDESGEALHPTVGGDVIGLNPKLTQKFVDILLGEALPQIRADGEDDDLGGDPNPTNADSRIAGIERERRVLI